MSTSEKSQLPTVQANDSTLATRRLNMRLTDTQFALLLLAPALLILTFTVLYPLLRSIYLSFQSYSLMNLSTGPRYIGLRNFQTLFNDKAYWAIWGTTIVFVISSVGGQFLLGFLTALVLNQNLKYRNLFRGLFLMPWIVPTVVAALLWKWIYNQQYGIFNYVLQSVGIIPAFRAWIGEPGLALFSVVLANIWKGFPFHMIVLLAALQTIPHDLNEAATMDGTSIIQRFRFITLPLMRYIIMIVLIISIIWTFQSFTMIWTMTEGGPVTATTTMAISIFRTAFQNFDLGQSATIGTIWLVALALFTLVFMGVMRGMGRAEYD
jgi:multiple sugar transport system permease protein